MTDESSIRHFLSEGFCEFPALLNARDAAGLFDAVKSTRRFDGSLFLSEAEWEAGPKTHKHTNPGPGYNILEKFPEKLGFVENDTRLAAFLARLLGGRYHILSKKLVCRLSWNMVPPWLQRKVKGKPGNTFGAYIHQPYRDMVYFLDNDLHQDIQDWNRMPEGQREHRFITLYAYLGEVTPFDAPVHILPGTHALGATPFQHQVTCNDSTGIWTYQDDKGNRIESHMQVLTGTAGYVALWHPCLIHGAPPVKEGHFRISLRYLIARSPGDAPCLLDEMNSTIKGPLYLDEDYTPGAKADKYGQWNLRMTDFIRRGYAYAELG
jgi:hypothetical protein